MIAQVIGAPFYKNFRKKTNEVGSIYRLPVNASHWQQTPVYVVCWNEFADKMKESRIQKGSTVFVDGVFEGRRIKGPDGVRHVTQITPKVIHWLRPRIPEGYRVVSPRDEDVTEWASNQLTVVSFEAEEELDGDSAVSLEHYDGHL